MISAIKVLLLLSALACLCHAQQKMVEDMCLCKSFSDTVGSKRNVADIQIYPATDFCGKVEIIVTNKSGGRYCLNPDLPVSKRLVSRILARK